MKEITDQLFLLRDLKYRDFNSRTVPNISKDVMIGVRIPLLRKMAKDLLQSGQYKKFIQSVPHVYLEENILHSCILTLLTDIDELMMELDNFLPYIDNWEVNDCLHPKILAQYPNRVLPKIGEWINTGKEYYIRFAVVTLLNFYLDGNFSVAINELVAGIKSDDYYANMAIAWYFSYALIKHYDETIYLFEEQKLSKWIHNKAIQKAIDSYQIDDVTKNYLRTLRIKERLCYDKI